VDLIVSGIETSNGATGTGSGECGNASVTFFEEGQNAMNLEPGVRIWAPVDQSQLPRFRDTSLQRCIFRRHIHSTE